jgi:hypothetical protein
MIEMAIQADDNAMAKEWQEQVAAELPRTVLFNFGNVEWTQVVTDEAGSMTGTIPESLKGHVNFAEYYAKGMWTAFIDAGAFNVLGVKLAPDYTIQRHHHNMHQLVLVQEGEVWQGNRCYKPGDGYFTRAYHPYSVTAGPEGSISFEIRTEPIGTLETIWDEADPAKWVHGRRPGGPAAKG